MNYEEYDKKLKELKIDMLFKKKRLEEAETELEVWQDYFDRMVEKGRP